MMRTFRWHWLNTIWTMHNDQAKNKMAQTKSNWVDFQPDGTCWLGTKVGKQIASLKIRDIFVYIYSFVFLLLLFPSFMWFYFQSS